MTDRDTFAAAALTGLLADESLGDLDDVTLVKRAYELASTMIDWREIVLEPMTKEKRAEVSAAPASRPAETRASGVARAQAWSCDLHRYVTADEEQRIANHDAAPAAKARTDSASCGRGCGGTDKPVTLPAVGTVDLSEEEIDALEYAIEEGRIASMDDYGVLQSLLVRVRTLIRETPGLVD